MSRWKISVNRFSISSSEFSLMRQRYAAFRIRREQKRTVVAKGFERKFQPDTRTKMGRYTPMQKQPNRGLCRGNYLRAVRPPLGGSAQRHCLEQRLNWRNQPLHSKPQVGVKNDRHAVDLLPFHLPYCCAFGDLSRFVRPRPLAYYSSSANRGPIQDDRHLAVQRLWQDMGD
jgi:hypothetical protein